MNNLDWIPFEVIYATKVGSQAYGMATENSDLDIKGVVIPPVHVRMNLFQKFEQVIDYSYFSDYWAHLKNPKNPKLESTFYSLEKFITLAAACNPNILELMWTDPIDVLTSHPVWDIIREHRNLFLSKRVKHTFTGYAYAQIAKIERHRKWILLDKAPVQPTRAQFGLNDPKAPQIYGEANRYIQRQIELWNLSNLELSTDDKLKLKEQCWELCLYLHNASQIDWDNWPDAYFQAGLVKLTEQLADSSVLSIIKAEKAYTNALREFNGYQHWFNERNPARRELEVKHSYDTKHGAHLVRLLRMGFEILMTGEVQVHRPDAKELLSIRDGAWTYEETMTYAKDMSKKIDEVSEISKLPYSVDYEKINELYQTIMTDYDYRK